MDDIRQVIDAINEKWDKGEIGFSSETSTSIVVNDCGIISTYTMANIQDDLLDSECNIIGLSQTQESDFTWFLKNKIELTKKYKDKWIIIKEATVIDFFDYLDRANEFSLNNLHLLPGSYLIQYCSNNPCELIKKVYTPKI